MYYLNHSFNNNIVGTVIQTKEELVAKIDEILQYSGCDTNKFYVANCEVKQTESINQKIENGQFVFDSEGKPIFETTIVDVTEEKEIIFEFDVLVGKKTELKALLSNLQ